MSHNFNDKFFFSVILYCVKIYLIRDFFTSGDNECHRRICFCDTKTGKVYSDKMEIHILELPKLPPEQQNESDLMQWMRFLSGKNREDLKHMTEKNSNLKEAYNELDKLSADEQKRLEYEARQKAIRDKNILLITGENRGLEKGIQATIETCQDFQIEKDNICLKLIDKFGLSKADARSYIAKYWK